MIARLSVLTFLASLTLALPATAQVRQVCVTVTSPGADGWGAVHCTPIDRPRSLPVRLRR